MVGTSELHFISSEFRAFLDKKVDERDSIDKCKRKDCGGGHENASIEQSGMIVRALL